MPVSNNTVLPSRSSTSNARHASGTRLFASGASHFDHIAFGALPNIAPPSSFCELPRIDQSFMSVGSLSVRGEQLIGGPMDIRGDLAKQDGRNIAACVKRYRCSAPVVMAELFVRSTLANVAKSKHQQQPNDLLRLQDRRIAHTLSHGDLLDADEFAFQLRLAVFEQHRDD